MSSTTLSGSCLCGQVRFTATGKTTHFYHCHCSRCRKASGTGHASNIFLMGGLTWESGEDQVVHYKLPEADRFTTSFCRTCGARAPRFIEKIGMVLIPAGSLDEEPDLGPQARIFTDSRTSWSCDESALPEFPEAPV
jgi:hypothetical protein